MTSLFWFTRDLRLDDNPALSEAAEAGDVVGVFIFSKELCEKFDRPRIQFLVESLRQLNASMHGALVVRSGAPEKILKEVAQQVGAAAVYKTKCYSTFRSKTDTSVASHLKLANIEMKTIDSPYAVKPGSIFKKDGTPYKVFTPFFKAWKVHGWDLPYAPVDADWVQNVQSEDLPKVSPLPAEVPPAGEQQAAERLQQFLDQAAGRYKQRRDLPGIDGTSQLSGYLKWGTLHPRQILAKLGSGVSEETYRSELCWREFYADVLHHRPETANQAFIKKMSKMPVDSGPETDEAFRKWSEGQTGYPIVDAGMRQLVQTGWMHNRVRMIVASFLVKDLHLDWTRGADFFMHHLIDGDLASNSHGWQWTAGTGTDASPYFRVFNPMTQGKKFDPKGTYIRKWIPELVHLPDKNIHEPWKTTSAQLNFSDQSEVVYPPPMVDHAEERLESLARYQQVKEMAS